MSHRVLLVAIAGACGLGGLACKSASPQPPPQPTTTATASASAVGSAAPTATAASTAHPAPAPSPTYTSKDKGILVEYSITPRDCDELGDHYAEVTRLDQRAGLPPKQTDKQREAAEAGIAQAAEQARAMWLKQCDGLVNMVYEKARIECALTSKTVAAFDACLNK